MMPHPLYKPLPPLLIGPGLCVYHKANISVCVFSVENGGQNRLELLRLVYLLPLPLSLQIGPS